MPLPRPARPAALWSDIRAVLRERPSHQWLAATLAVLIPIGLITAFYFDSLTNIRPRETITYVESWPADRTDAQIKAKQKADLERRRAAEAERRRQFQELDEQLNSLGI
ncbi:MAG TPA: hypothetical protein VF704_13720 [Allosphingosinicella sp.]|jgi:hypothetical protein